MRRGAPGTSSSRSGLLLLQLLRAPSLFWSAQQSAWLPTEPAPVTPCSCLRSMIASMSPLVVMKARLRGL